MQDMNNQDPEEDPEDGMYGENDDYDEKDQQNPDA